MPSHARSQLRIDALTAAVQALEQRHETLRTTFEERNGVGVQVVQQAIRTKELRLIDASAKQDGKESSYLQLLQQEQISPFDLDVEPGWRVLLLRLGEDDHVLSIVMHHIISDGWSVDILRQELSQFYAIALQGKSPLTQVSQLPIQYRDFAVWQKQAEQTAQHQRQLEYWIKQLTDSSPAELLADRPRPDILSQTGQAGTIRFGIESSVYEKLRAFCRAHQTTNFAVLLAVFRAVHYRLTGAEDATIGTPIAGRNRLELERYSRLLHQHSMHTDYCQP